MKIAITLFLIISAPFSFCQTNLSAISPEVIKSNGITRVQENWMFFDENEKVRNNLDVRTFYYRPVGQKDYGIEYDYDMIETRDSIIFEYDSLNREILKKIIVEINPGGLEMSDFSLEVAESIDTVKEWRTFYEANVIKKIDPRGDTITTILSKSGKILSEVNSLERLSFSYNKNDELIEEVKMPFELTWGRNRHNKSIDTIVTTFNKLGNPIQTRGSNVSINYTYKISC